MKRLVLLGALALAACDDVTDPPPPPHDGGAGASGCDVPKLFADTCVSGCHDTGTRQAGLDLESPGLAARLYGRRSAGRADYLLIDPEIPEESALVLKLSAAPPFGSRMPQTGGPLSAAQRACVLQWVLSVVDAGVPDGGDAVPPDAGSRDGGSGDAGTQSDAGVQDAGHFWGPAVDATGCAPDGGAWCIDQRVPEPLYAVRGTSATDVWAVGSRGATYHYDGNAWTRSDAGVGVTLFDVHAVSPSDVWAVGEQATVVHFDGSAWHVVPWSPPTAFVDGGLLPSGAPPRDLGGVWATATEAWICGAGDTFAHFSGGALRVTQSTSPNEITPDMLKIWRRSATEWWAAGDLAFRKNAGSGWAPSPGGVRRIFGLWGAVNPTNQQPIVLAVGADGAMLSYDYNDPGMYPWQPPGGGGSLDLTRDLRGVWLEDATARGWTVGLDGQIVRVDMGTPQRFSREVTPVGDHLLGVWGTSVSRSWAVGGRIDGVILRSR